MLMFIYWIQVRPILRPPRPLDAVDLLSISLSNCTIYPICISLGNRRNKLPPQYTNQELRSLPPSHNPAATLQSTGLYSPAPTSLSTSQDAKSPKPTQQSQRAQTPMPRKRLRASSDTQRRLGQSPPGGIWCGDRPRGWRLRGRRKRAVCGLHAGGKVDRGGEI